MKHLLKVRNLSKKRRGQTRSSPVLHSRMPGSRRRRRMRRIWSWLSSSSTSLCAFFLLNVSISSPTRTLSEYCSVKQSAKCSSFTMRKLQRIFITYSRMLTRTLPRHTSFMATANSFLEIMRKPGQHTTRPSGSQTCNQFSSRTAFFIKELAQS